MTKKTTQIHCVRKRPKWF